MSVAGRLVILSGPSGVGKDAVLAAWQEINPQVRRVVAYTTRLPRAGEVDGADYHFVDRNEFERLARDGAFLEHKEVFGNGYATPLRDMEEMLGSGLIAVLKIDVQGAVEAMGLRPDALSIFLLPPDETELERRIRSRGTEDAEVLERRLRQASDEIEMSRHYRHRVVNRDVSQAVEELEGLVRSPG